MRFADRVKAFFGLQKLSAGFLLGWGHATYSSPFKYETYAKDGLRQNPVVYACIEEITGAAKKIGIVLKRNNELVEGPRGEELKILDLLRWPNPNQSFEDFIEVWHQQMNLSGMTFIRAVNIDKDTMGDFERIREGSIWLLPPNEMTIIAKGMLVEKYAYRGSTDFSPKEVMHLLFPDPLEEFQGLPPLRPGALATDAHNRLYQWNNNMLEGGGIPPIMIGVKGIASMLEEDITKLIDKWDEKYAGSKNAGKPFFFPGEGLDVARLGMNANELDWLGGEAMLARRICNVFKVPPQILGDPDTSKYSNYKEARKALYNEKVLPDMRKLIAGLNRWLMPKFGKEYTLDLDISDIEVLRDDENERVTRVARSTWLTINEQRESEGLPPVEGGDEVYQPFNLVPLGAVNTETDEQDNKADFRAAQLKYRKSLYNTEEKRAAAWLRNESRRIAWEVSYQSQVNKYFRGQLERTLERLNNYAAQLNVEFRMKEGKLDAEQLDIFDEADKAAKYADEMYGINVSLTIDFGESALAELLSDAAFDVERPVINDWLTENLARNSKTINKATAKNIKKILQEGLDLGEGQDKLAKRLRDEYSDFSKWRSRTIARTEVGGASGKAKLEGYDQAGVQSKEWLSARDAVTRDTHFEADGQIVKINEPFYVGGYATESAPAQTGVAAEDINCFPGNIRVIAAGIEKAYSRFYDGEVITIETARGYKAAVTPNHPILCRRGWVPANLIVKGDNIACDTTIDWITLPNHNVEDAPSTFEQVYSALEEMWPCRRNAGTVMNFHGDGRDSYVDIISADGQLRDWFKAKYAKIFRNLSFALANFGTGLIPRPRAFDKLLLGTSFGASGSAGSLGESAQLTGTHLTKPNDISLTAVAQFNATSLEPVSDDVPRNAKGTRDTKHGLPANIAFDDAVNIKSDSFSGHVYNLQTETGLYIANGIISHNCRCTFAPVIGE